MACLAVPSFAQIGLLRETVKSMALEYLSLMSRIEDRFEHRLNRNLEREAEGLQLIESTCNTCGSSMTVSIGDAWLARGESQHTCGSVRLLHPISPSFPR